MTEEGKNLLDPYQKANGSQPRTQTETNHYQKIAQATPNLISNILHKYASGRLG
jgi:hypothetical protein